MGRAPAGAVVTGVRRARARAVTVRVVVAASVAAARVVVAASVALVAGAVAAARAAGVATGTKALSAPASGSSSS